MTDNVKLKSGEINGASAVGHILDTYNSLTTAGAQLVSVKNAGVEKFSVDKDGRLAGTSLPVLVVKPSEGSAGITTAMNVAANLGGGVIQLLAGTYIVNSVIYPTFLAPARGPSNIILQGVGASTILEHNGILTGAMIAFQGGYIFTRSINNITKNDTSITYPTPADAANILQGDYISLFGLDPDTSADAEYNIAAADGDADTGIVSLVYPIQKTLTTVTASGTRGGTNITIRDLRMTSSGPLTNSYAIDLTSTHQTTIERVQFDNFHSDSIAGIILLSGAGINNIVRECKFSNIISGGINLAYQIGSQVLDCDFIGIAQNLGSSKASILLGTSNFDIEISRNVIHRSGCYGILTGAGTGSTTRRVLINENLIKNTVSVAIGDIQSETNVEDNIIEDTGTAPAITYIGDKNIIIKGNTIKNSATGIDGSNAAGSEIIISGNNIITTSSVGLRCKSANSLITNNIIKDSVNYGIWVQGGGCIVIGNRIIGVTGTGTGIQVDTTDQNIISENMVTGATLGIDNSVDDSIITSNHCFGIGVTDTGSSNTVANNIV
jgi:hypothetical protein